MHTGKVDLLAFVKGVGFEKGRGIPLPFSVLLVPFVTSQKERPFLFPLEEGQVRSCFPLAGERDGTFFQSKKSTQKCFFADRTAIREGQSRIPGFAIAFILYRLFVCTRLHDHSAFPAPAKCCFADPLHAKSVLTFFVSVLDRR